MRKMSLFAAVAAVGVIFIAGSIYAGGHKYRQAPYEPPEAAGDEASAESVTSMSDCMTFSANHKSKGHAEDKAEFKKQYGEPVSAQGSVFMYNYDKYTNVVLDCMAKKCNCRCLSKN